MFAKPIVIADVEQQKFPIIAERGESFAYGRRKYGTDFGEKKKNSFESFNESSHSFCSGLFTQTISIA